MLQYSENRCVFSKRLKLSLPRSGSLQLSGREFQSDGPATEKARGPSVLSRHRGTTKRRRVDAALLRRRTLAHRDLRGTAVIGRASNVYITTQSLYWTLPGTPKVTPTPKQHALSPLQSAPWADIKNSRSLIPVKGADWGCKVSELLSWDDE